MGERHIDVNDYIKRDNNKINNSHINVPLILFHLQMSDREIRKLIYINQQTIGVDNRLR